MGEASVVASQWRMVEVGRVVLFSNGPFAGRLAAIVEIIDHKRVLVEGPSENKDLLVPRHSSPLAALSLTRIVIDKLPRGAGSAALAKMWQAQEVEGTWNKSTYALNKAKTMRRRELNDFERFKAMRLKKQVRFQHRKSFAAAKASA